MIGIALIILLKWGLRVARKTFVIKDYMLRRIQRFNQLVAASSFPSTRSIPSYKAWRPNARKDLLRGLYLHTVREAAEGVYCLEIFGYACGGIMWALKRTSSKRIHGSWDVRVSVPSNDHKARRTGIEVEAKESAVSVVIGNSFVSLDAEVLPASLMCSAALLFFFFHLNE